jgi:hypothetical protein
MSLQKKYNTLLSQISYCEEILKSKELEKWERKEFENILTDYKEEAERTKTHMNNHPNVDFDNIINEVLLIER